MPASYVEFDGVQKHIGFTAEDVPWETGREITRLWHQKRGDRAFPARTDFSPRELKRALPDLALVNVQWQPPELTIRLIGTALAAELPHDPTGWSLKDLPNGERVTRRAWHDAGLGTPALVRNVPVFWAGKEDFRTYHSLMFPLSSDGTHVDIIMYHFLMMPQILDE